MLSTEKGQCPDDSRSSPAEARHENSSDGLQRMLHTEGPLSIKSGKGKSVFTPLL